MNKRVLLYLLCMLFVSSMYAEKVGMAPLIIYDGNNQQIYIDEKPENEIFQKLCSEWFEGLYTFEGISENEIYTAIEANRLCSTEGYDLFIYGFVQKTDTSWYGNLKLFSNGNKKVIKEFYSADDYLNYDRFLTLMIERVINGLMELGGITTKVAEDSVTPFKFSIPISLTYWNPIDTNWVDVLEGIGSLNLEFNLKPSQRKIILGSCLLDFSFGIYTSYLYGIGNEKAYPLNYHGIQLGLLTNCHLFFNKSNSIYFTVGPYTEMEIMQIRPLYDDINIHYQNAAGIKAGVGYEYIINDFISCYLKTDFDFQIKNNPWIIISPGAGLRFKVCGGN